MTFRRSVNRLVLLASLCLLATLQLFAGGGFTQDFDCFSIVVGKKASADGSVMFGHNEDVFAPVVNLYKVPGASHTQGEFVVLRKGGKVPQATETPGYFWLNVPGWDVCDGYVNEHGVAVGSDGCPSREENPDLTDGGILFWLRRLVAERATTAREGVKLAGDLIDRFGYNSSGRSYVIADEDEAWVLAAVNGKHWVAQRVPDDQVAVIANCYTIQEIDLSDTANFLGSPDIVDYAVKRGWYDASKDGKFSFAKAYSNPGSLAHPANIGRMWRGFDLLAGREFDINKQIPFAVAPTKKLTPQDLMRTMRDRYDGDELEDPSQAYICHEGTRYSMIAHIRSWLPAEIKAVVWLAMHRPDLQTYCAWYPALGSIPEAYATEDHETGLRKHLDTTFTPDKRARSVAYARIVELDDKTRPDSLASIRVKEAWSSFEKRALRAQADFEKKAARLLKRDPDKAARMITDHTARWAQEVYRRAEELLNPLCMDQAASKELPLPGEVFSVNGRPAFVILPQDPSYPLPWVWYAPTLPGLPAEAERWMFEHFTRAGIAVAGIDVGESYGSPDGRRLFSALHTELTQRWGFSSKPVLLGRSRGGLMTLSWAEENPEKVAAWAGIYPVCSIASYPGIEEASSAYHMTPAELTAHLTEHNPIDRLQPLAMVKIPLFAIHGDVDKLVPLEANSGELKKRYDALGGPMQLIIPKGQGHNMWEGFFQSQELVDFVTKWALADPW